MTRDGPEGRAFSTRGLNGARRRLGLRVRLPCAAVRVDLLLPDGHSCLRAGPRLVPSGCAHASATTARALRLSIPYCVASSASRRCADETATTTLASPTGTTPVRCAMATLHTSHRSRMRAHTARSSRTACARPSRVQTGGTALPGGWAHVARTIGSYASYSSRSTRLPSNALRVTPMKVAMAPALSSATTVT